MQTDYHHINSIIRVWRIGQECEIDLFYVLKIENLSDAGELLLFFY